MREVCFCLSQQIGLNSVTPTKSNGTSTAAASVATANLRAVHGGENHAAFGQSDRTEQDTVCHS